MLSLIIPLYNQIVNVPLVTFAQAAMQAMMDKIPTKTRYEDFQDTSANRKLKSDLVKLNKKTKSQATYDFRKKIKIAVWVSPNISVLLF